MNRLGLLGAGLSLAAADISVVLMSDGTDYGGFSFPEVTDEVSFMAFFADGSDGLVSESAGSLGTIASTQTPVPDGGSGNFTAFGNHVLGSKASVFVGSSSDPGYGLYVYEDGATAPRTLVDIFDEMPGEQGLYSFFTAPDLDEAVEDTLVTFTGVTDASNYTGVFKMETGDRASAEIVVDTETAIPGLDGSIKFRCLDSSSIWDGSVAFFGSYCPNVGGSVYADQLLGDRMVGTRRASDHALAVANVYPGIWRAVPGANGYETVANWDTLVPGGGDDEVFIAFSQPTFRDDYVAFVGMGELGTMGIFRYSTASQELEAVATVWDGVPNEGNRTFGDFPEQPSVSGDRVVFFAEGAEDDTGIYIWDGSTKELATVVDMSTEIVDGQVPIYIGNAQDAFNGTDVVFYSVLENNDFGIFSASV